MTNELWVVEYSVSQGQFHVETLDVILTQNATAFVENLDASRDYVPLAIATSHERAKEEMRRLIDLHGQV